MKRIKPKTIEIVLENCEVFTFSAEDVTLRFWGLGKFFWENMSCFTAEDAKILIRKDATASGGWDNEKWQDRIHKDITLVYINYTNGSQEGFSVDWSDKSEYENEYEKDTEDEFYKIYTISKKKKPKV